MVKLGDEKYAISLGSIQTIEDIPVSEIKYVHAKEVIHLRGNVIPLIRLRELLDVPGEQEEEQQQAEHHPHQQCADTQDAVHDKPFVHKGGDAPTRKGHLPQDEQIVAGPPVGVQLKVPLGSCAPFSPNQASSSSRPISPNRTWPSSSSSRVVPMPGSERDRSGTSLTWEVVKYATISMRPLRSVV